MTTELENTDEASVTLNVRYGYQDNDFRRSIELPAQEVPTAAQLSHLLIGVFDAAAASENLDLHAGEKPRAMPAFARPAGQVVPPSAHYSVDGTEIDAKYYPIETMSAAGVRALLQRRDRELAAAVNEKHIAQEKLAAVQEANEDLVQQAETARAERFEANASLQSSREAVRTLRAQSVEQQRAYGESLQELEAKLEETKAQIENVAYEKRRAAELEEANTRLNKQLDDVVRTSTARLNENNRLINTLHQIAGIAQESGNA